MISVYRSSAPNSPFSLKWNQKPLRHFPRQQCPMTGEMMLSQKSTKMKRNETERTKMKWCSVKSTRLKIMQRRTICFICVNVSNYTLEVQWQQNHDVPWQNYKDPSFLLRMLKMDGTHTHLQRLILQHVLMIDQWYPHTSCTHHINNHLMICSECSIEERQCCSRLLFRHPEKITKALTDKLCIQNTSLNWSHSLSRKRMWCQALVHSKPMRYGKTSFVALYIDCDSLHWGVVMW